jgi:hypothetical protein
MKQHPVPKEQEEIEEEDKCTALKGGGFLLALIRGVGFVGDQIGKENTPQPQIIKDPSGYDRGYNVGYGEGKQLGN